MSLEFSFSYLLAVLHTVLYFCVSVNWPNSPRNHIAQRAHCLPFHILYCLENKGNINSCGEFGQFMDTFGELLR